ncbi:MULTISPECIES: autotransporter domain-containing protein [unclassified Methylobacterium]|uniref:autotransporter outer membrane beta-barrel domain-containing protein n=4 Tax=Methylobacterium TaxID=407 RepID=UPI001650A717|nr:MULTISPECIES: autotransporter domain-containing protein [unclassified Methylobacterium]
MPHLVSCPPRRRLLATTAVLPLILGAASMAAPDPARAACVATATGLACDGPDDATLASPVVGPGGLSKAGTGRVTLSAANTYAGGTSLSAGTLATSAPGTLGATDGALLVSGGRLDLGGTNQAVGLVRLTGGTIADGTLRGSVYDVQSGGIEAALTGPGPLVKTGAGTVTLSGANDFSGGTRVDGGTLQLTGSGRLGAADAALVVGGGTLDLGGTASSAGPVVLTAGTIRNGTLRGAIYGLQSGTVDAVLSGPGTLAKSGDGTVLLTQANSYAGTTSVTNGTLRAGIAGALPAGSALLVAGAGTFDLAGYDQSVAALNGDGRVSLGGATLTAGSNGTDALFSGTIDGTGTIVKTGAGRLDLTGDSPFAGGVTVAEGRLRVGGDLGAADVGVASGATIEGIGTLGGLSVRSGGRAAPGYDGIGTLSANGNVLFEAGSIFQVKADAAGNSDRIAAGGVATLRGGLVDVQAQPGAYSANTTYTILTAAGGVQGQFAAVTSNFAFLTPSLTYADDAVQLHLIRNDLGFDTAGATVNGVAAGRRAQSLGAGQAVYDAVGPLSTAQARQAFDALSGEVHASAVTALVESGGLAREAILDRMRWSDGAGLTCTPAAPGLPAERAPIARVPLNSVPECGTGLGPGGLDQRIVGLWGQGFGSFGRTGSDGNAAALQRNTGGLVIGGDVAASDLIRVGAAAGYTDTALDIPLRMSSGNVQTGFGSVYAGIGLGALDLRIGGLYGISDTETRRDVAFAGFRDSARASYGGSVAQGFGEIGYRMDLAGLTLEPFAGGAVIRVGQDAFSETGGAAALTGAARDATVSTATAGVRAEARIDGFVGGLPMLLRGLVGYRGALGDVTPNALLAFNAGGVSALTRGAPVDRSAVLLETGLSWIVLPSTTVGLSYAGQIGARAQDHGAKGNLTYRF